MPEFFEALGEQHRRFIQEQPMFFVATAAHRGRISLSPKGLDSFRIFSDKRVGYLDITGSGNETAGHLKNDGRMTIMFNSFSRNALILRLYGRGHVLRPQHVDFENYKTHFPALVGVRQIILMDIESLQTSCGWGVPIMELVGKRQTLEKWANGKSAQELSDYQQDNNKRSIDGFDTGLND